MVDEDKMDDVGMKKNAEDDEKQVDMNMDAMLTFMIDEDSTYMIDEDEDEER